MKSKHKLIKSKEFWIEVLENMDYRKLSYEDKAKHILTHLSKVEILRKTM